MISKALGKLFILAMAISVVSAEPIRINSSRSLTAMHQPEAPKQVAAAVDDKGVLHVTFQAYSERQKRNDVFYSRLAPGDKAVQTQALTSSEPGILPDLTLSNGKLFSVWSEKDKRNGAIVFASSDDGGKTWARTFLPVKTERETDANVVALTGGHLIVYGSARLPEFGAQHEVYLLRSTDGGKTWTTSSPTSDLEGESIEPVLIEWEPQQVVLAWIQTDGKTWKVTTRQSTDGGQTWEDPRVVNDEPRFPAARPCLATAGEQLVVFWSESTAFGKRLVADTVRKNMGWGKDQNLSGEEVSELRHQVTPTGKLIQVAYLTKSGSGRLRRYKLFSLQLDPRRLASGKPADQPRLVYESFFGVHFDSVNLKSGPAVGVSYRETSLLWKISLFFGEKKRSSDGILRLAPDLGGRERALLFLLPLPDGLGVLYREQKARQVPPALYAGELWFERIRLPK